MGFSAGRRPGRPAGARNKRTDESLARMQVSAERLLLVMPDAFHGDAHALLMSVYKDPAQPIAVRIEAADKAIGYEKPKLAAQRVDIEVTHSLRHLSDAGWTKPLRITPQNWACRLLTVDRSRASRL
jgi:hypothetical protein